MQAHSYRTIFLSDFHLGSRDINSTFLYDFLQRHDAEYLYLVGDIIDFWKINNGWHWPEINNRIIDLILEKCNRGTKVFYIPGNHDDLLRKYSNMEIKGVRLVQEAVHRNADGRRFLVLHGDQFDKVSTGSKRLARLGSDAYQLLLLLNRYVSICRRRLGLDYWSLSAFLKHQVKVVVNFLGNFKKEIVHEARRREVDGLICGHVHHASFEEMNGVVYTNTGDWVESCTALVENHDGSFRIIRWADRQSILFDERNVTVAREKYADCYNNGRLAPTS